MLAERAWQSLAHFLVGDEDGSGGAQYAALTLEHHRRARARADRKSRLAARSSNGPATPAVGDSRALTCCPTVSICNRSSSTARRWLDRMS